MITWARKADNTESADLKYNNPDWYDTKNKRMSFLVGYVEIVSVGRGGISGLGIDLAASPSLILSLIH